MEKSFKQLYEEARKDPMHWAYYLEAEIQTAIWNSPSLKDHRKHIYRLVEKATDKVYKIAKGKE